MRFSLSVGPLLLVSLASSPLWSAGHFGFIVQLPGATRVIGVERDPKGDLIVAGRTSSDLFAAKYSRSGEPVWTVPIGGSSWEELSAFAVDPAGDVYVLGMTGSADFPGYVPTGRFLLKLSGATGQTLNLYRLNIVSLYGLAIDPQGRPWIAAGDNFGKFLTVPRIERLDPASGQIEQVVIPPSIVTRIAFDGDGTPWLLASNRLFRLSGTDLTTVWLGSTSLYLQTLRAAGNRVCAGGVDYRTAYAACIDARSGEVVSTWETPAPSGPMADVATALDLDPDGALWVGGNTGNLGFPTRATLQGGFNSSTGFLTHQDLTGAVVESTFVGDWRPFEFTGVAAGREHTVFVGNTRAGEAFLVEIIRDTTPAVRIDAISPDADGRFVVRGAGFVDTATVSFDGEPGIVLEQSPDRLIVVPPDHPFPAGFTIIRVESGGVPSNAVLISTRS